MPAVSMMTSMTIAAADTSTAGLGGCYKVAGTGLPQYASSHTGGHFVLSVGRDPKMLAVSARQLTRVRLDMQIIRCFAHYAQLGSCHQVLRWQQRNAAQPWQVAR
jgi:hypothetical protein